MMNVFVVYGWGRWCDDSFICHVHMSYILCIWIHVLFGSSQSIGKVQGYLLCNIFLLNEALSGSYPLTCPGWIGVLARSAPRSRG